MKRLMILLFAAATISGCATREERARTALIRTWRIDKVFANDQDITQSYLSSRENYRITFTNNGTFTETFLPFSGGQQVSVAGTWDFTDGITKISLVDDNQSRVYQVDELEEDILRITDLGSSNNRKIEFLPD